jgi:hypothetical protein
MGWDSPWGGAFPETSGDERSEMIRSLQARVEELEKECEELARDRQNWKTLANRDFPVELKETNRKLAKKNAKLQRVVDAARGVFEWMKGFQYHKKFPEFTEALQELNKESK